MVQIPMSRDVALSVSWGELAAKAAEAVAQGLLTVFGGDGISGGITALFGAAATVKVEGDPGERAWSIAILCFAWVLDELKCVSGTDELLLRRALSEILADAKERVDAGKEFVPHTFLERPTTLPLYQVLREALIARKASFRTGLVEADAVLRARLDAAYDRAMFEVLSRRQELYQSLSTVFTMPVIDATERRLNWTAYRSRLIFEFEVNPVFGQETSKVALSQLYIPLRSCWPKSEDLPVDAAYGNLRYSHNVAITDELLDRWIDENDQDDVIRLVGGGPGSGKSTTLKAFARRMADREDWSTLFIPLVHINLEADLRDDINRYFITKTNGSFTQAPLSRAAVEDGPSLLLIFDGLDELVRPGDAANEVVGLFSTRLANIITSLRGECGKPVKVLVSGRMPSFQSARRLLSPPKYGCLEVCGFTSLEIAGAATADEILWNKDQRIDWWQQYAALVGVAPELPEAFKSYDLKGITHEPLLCYLLVLSGFISSNWEQAAENRNRIYKTLVDSIWERGWGDRGASLQRKGPSRTLPKADFNLLMQTIALAAWQGGDTRIASESGFFDAIKTTHAEDAWQTFKGDNGSDVTNLAMNFYLKAAEGRQRGFEFTHKSFGDYLAARAILDIAEDLPVLIRRKIDHAMTDWVECTGSGVLTNEILTFLQDEVRLRISNNANDAAHLTQFIALKAAFERLVSNILLEGLPQAKGAVTWRVAETRQRNGEIAAWAVLNACSLAIAKFDSVEKFVRVDWPDKKLSLRQLLQRVSLERARDVSVMRCFSYLVAPEADLFGMLLSYIDLRGAVLDGAVFSGCHLIRANLSCASLNNCVFQRAMLDGSDFSFASMKDADLTDSRLASDIIGHEGEVISAANFHGAIMEGVLISDSTLIYAELPFIASVASGLRIRDARMGLVWEHPQSITRIDQIRQLSAKMRKRNHEGVQADQAG